MTRFVLALASLATLTLHAAPVHAEKLTDEQRATLRDLGGEALVTDAERVQAQDPKDKKINYQETQCLIHYIQALKYERSGKASQATGQFRSCAVMCAAAAKKSESALADLGTKYAPLCQKKQRAIDGRSHLERAQKKLVEFKAATGLVNWYHRAAEVRGALEQASEKLGASPEVQAVEASFRALEQERKEGLAKVTKFMTRKDIVELQRRRDRVQDHIRAIEKDFGVSPRAETVRVELEHLKSDLRSLDAKWAFEAKAAGVL